MAPVPKGRPRFNSRTHITYTPKETLEYEDAVRRHFISKYGLENAPMDGAILAVYEFILLRPKSVPKKAVHSSTKPDIDNFIKSFQDALDFKTKSLGGVELGVIANDSRISVLAATKRYAREDETPGTRYRIQRLSASMAVIPENADLGFKEAFIPTMPSMAYAEAEMLASKLETGKASKAEREAAELVRIAFVIPPFGVSSAEARQIIGKAFPKIRSIRSAF